MSLVPCYSMLSAEIASNIMECWQYVYLALGLLLFTNESCWGKVITAAFLGMRKAFDSLDHALLLQCLSSSIGYLQYWNSMVFLSDCVQRVKCDHSYFGWGPVLGGIPQGSKYPGTPLIFGLCEWYAFTNTEWVTSAVCWHLSDLLWWWSYTS